MAVPSTKAPEIEELLKMLATSDRRVSIAANKCLAKPLGCGGDASEFTDEQSMREFTISGLCQRCQDEIFGVGGVQEVIIP